MAIHGGGWRRFDKSEYGKAVATFTSSGYVVISPDYTLSSSTSPGFPRNLNDLRDAVRWMRRNAASLGIDPERIVAMDESAGGNLAEFLGTTATPPNDVSSKVEAVVSFFGPTDLIALDSAAWAAKPGWSRRLGGTALLRPEAYQLASPLDQVSAGDPPMILVHGSADWLVPVSQSEAMSRALDQVGVRN